MWGFLSPIAKAAGGQTPGRGLPVTPASCAKAQQSSLGAGTPSAAADRDMLVKVTFHAIHDSAPQPAAMYLTGSLPSLGSWDVKRARKMNRSTNGSWALAIYIPEKAEFLYQYLLLQEPEHGAASQEPVVLWEGGLERKCKLVDRCEPSSLIDQHSNPSPRDCSLFSIVFARLQPGRGNRISTQTSGQPSDFLSRAGATHKILGNLLLFSYLCSTVRPLCSPNNRSMTVSDDTRGEGSTKLFAAPRSPVEQVLTIKAKAFQPCVFPSFQ